MLFSSNLHAAKTDCHVQVASRYIEINVRQNSGAVRPSFIILNDKITAIQRITAMTNMTFWDQLNTVD